ncbi:hypothetical protein [Nostoc sp. MS1]|uniref:hypothetical protein n=1 Tax=Nostoc sp. MS1 TaxID=2764711 RepID=UPI001CC53126|nr:hypothetical protein [Nostoc sp. MS1]BCL38930.1 hypothetical protein NSMS1_53770 [Nostoc sp. MS1]
MNYQKLDSALTMALNQQPEGSLEVFISTDTDLDAKATAVLENLGVSGVKSGQEIFTANLTPQQIVELSVQPWVRFLKRSQKLRLLNNR